MLTIDYDPHFLSLLRKIKNSADKEKVKKHILKIIGDPEIGKPMRYARKGTWETYCGSFRLAYAYLSAEEKIIFLDLYHKDEQ